MTDFILMGLLLLALCLNKNMLPAVVSYALCVVYQYTLFDDHSAVVNHVTYGVLFIPLVYFAVFRLSLAMFFYAVFHWVVAVDYLLYSNIETFISINYNVMQIVLAISLIYAGVKRGHNGATDNNQLALNSGLGLANIWNLQTPSNPRKRG